ncbi:hypothetical protein BMETH_1688_0 [methanotrophic bacterial endosymbiont of Bathymodiolus sp.]|nr:hypothetical protein BMETH_1688_0 [methanotrophic bacterial endosymbiont of Bathymodiolus sp.]
MSVQECLLSQTFNGLWDVSSHPLSTGYEVYISVNSYTPISVTFCEVSLTFILNT